MQDTTNYPHFIADKPIGEDCFDGHSQEMLAKTMCGYMRRVDEMPDDSKMATLPRIIGLEGSWGSGKSNVVSMLDKALAKEGYYTFTYDAWGHQEDLQRRSILETMATKLIADKVLDGKVEIQLRNGKKPKKPWSEHLSYLLSNKITTIRKSTPKLTSAAFWGIGIVALFAICTHITELWSTEICHSDWYWLLDLLPVALALGIVIYYWLSDNGFENIFRMVDHTSNDQIDEEYTSSEEPSVAEFKNWMRAISDYLRDANQEKKRLIIVFDNMDRLPSEKVMQLWSSIYTFFAGGEFEHIWTIIPYDYKHLCEAIYGCNSKNDDKERIKQFVNKTFPVTYHVPQPVITDYRKLFFTYFDKAFGNGVHDGEHICQVFMHLEGNPNPRTVIRFVNELVAMRQQWAGEKYRLQIQALYILKKHWLLYGGKSLEANLLSGEMFSKVEPFYPNKDEVRAELCQYAYGLEDEALAKELPLHHELQTRIKEGHSISEYAEQPNFIAVLEKVLNEVDKASINNAVKSMASLNDVKFSGEMAERIQAKWDWLANKKAECDYEKHQYDETLTTLISHATQRRAVEMARAFAKAMQSIDVTDGAAYFFAQNELQRALKTAKIPFDDSDWYNEIECTPEQFVSYVIEAKEHYADFGLTTNVEELNNYLLNEAKDANEVVATAIDYIKDDESFDFKELHEDLAALITKDVIKEKIYTAAYVNRVLSDGDGILKVRFKKEAVAAYLNGDRDPWETHLPKGIEDVMAMSLADGKDLADIDEELVPRICNCMNSYLVYTDVLKSLGNEGSLFRKLNIYCIKHQEGQLLDTIYAARQLEAIQQGLGLDITLLFKQFNRWPIIDWGEMSTENEYVKDVKNIVHQSLFAAYRDNPGPFSDSLIHLGVQTISEQKTEFLAKQEQQRQGYNTVTVRSIDSYWKDFVMTFLGTSYMKEAGALLTNEAVTMLSWLYDYNESKEPELLDKILQYADAATLHSYLHTLMNVNLSKADINNEKFLRFGRLLPMLGANMDDNTARGLIIHFVKPASKYVECAAVIVANKDFYLDILRKDATIAEPIAKEMAAMDEYAEIKKELETITADAA